MNIDFDKFVDRENEKSVFTAKIDEDVYKLFQDTKKRHRDEGCTPYKIHEIVQQVLVTLTARMEEDIKRAQK